MIEDVRISLCSLREGSFFKMEFYLGLCYTEQKEERYTERVCRRGEAMMRKLKTAVIGCGDISSVYLDNMIHRFSILDVACCCSAHGESAKRQAEKYGIKAVEFSDILADDTIDLAVNLTPPKVHYEIVKELLNAGKHVYTEKVVTADFAKAMELKGLAEEKGLRLGVAPDTFLGAGLQTAAKAVRDGLIGDVTSCHASVNRDMGSLYPSLAFTAEPGGGIGFDVGIYYITALLSILGPVQEASGFLATRRPKRKIIDPGNPRFGEELTVKNENLMMANLIFQNGTMGTLHFNGDSIFPEKESLVLYGTEGVLFLPNPDTFAGPVRLVKKGCDDVVTLPLEYGFASNSRGVGAAELAWSLNAGRKHRASMEMACHAVELLNGLVQSSRERTSYQMTTTFEKPESLPCGYRDGYMRTNAESALV